MSMSWCEGCEKRIDTDFVEFQQNGSLYCDNCLDEMELEPVAEQGTDWKALAGELAEAAGRAESALSFIYGGEPLDPSGAIAALRAALAKYEQEVRA
jgi:hypothetical protein